MRASDNLLSASLVLLVEGPIDQAIVAKALAERSKQLKNALNDNTLKIDSINGATNLTYHSMLYKNAVCDVHALIDDDDAGRSAVSQALGDGVLAPNEYHVVTLMGQEKSELEDALDPASYAELLLSEFGVTIEAAASTQAKWSQKMKSAFKASGKLLDAEKLRQLKTRVCQHVGAQQVVALTPAGNAFFMKLAQDLEVRLNSRSRNH
jgi:putative ATP-dependent endonuclease of OLD family